MLSRCISFLFPLLRHAFYSPVFAGKPGVTLMKAGQLDGDWGGKDGTVDINRDLFNSEWTVYALRVPPRHCHALRKILKPHLLAIPRIQVVVKPVSEESENLLLLSRYLARTPSQDPRLGRTNLDGSYIGRVSDIARAFVSCGPSAPENVQEFLMGITDDRFTTWNVRQTYSNCGTEQVLRTLLPDEVQVPTSFESVGHIAHVNLREEQVKWKFLIGQVMIDKLGPRIRTVVNKTESTGGPYRTFTMEVIGGDPDLVTSVKENGCTFELDFEKVYWNSRLEREHRRVVDSFSETDIVLDAFCGVGPFAVAAAKRGRCLKVYANDLNPMSVKYLQINVKKNGISDAQIETSCSCAREYIKDVARRKIKFTKVVMNFPSGAPEFLDVFRNLYADWEEKPVMPTIYCYCFVKGDDEIRSARSRVRHSLVGEDRRGLRILPDSAIVVRLVRDVAPRKVQVCVTFVLPEEVAIESPDDNSLTAPDTKRSKLDDGRCTGPADVPRANKIKY